MACIKWKIEGCAVSMTPVRGSDLMRAGHQVDMHGKPIIASWSYEYSNTNGRPTIRVYPVHVDKKS